MYRRVLYDPRTIERLALLYTDAESSGQIAAVLVSEGVTRCLVATIPARDVRRLHRRRTQIVAFELLAAVSGLSVFSQYVDLNARLLRFIDARAALNIVIKGASRQSDLNEIVGALWLQLSERQTTYWTFHVPSKANLADGPSRGVWNEMKALPAQYVTAESPDLGQVLDMFRDPAVSESVAW